MQNCLFRKCLVIGIIILFVGASVLPNISGNIRELITIKNINRVISEKVEVSSTLENLSWQWATSGGGNGQDFGYDICVDSNGNSYITGRFVETASFGSTVLTSSGEVDVFVAKVDVNGNWQWAISAGGSSDDYSRGIDVDSNGNSYITGWYHNWALFGSTYLTSNGAQDVFVAKVDVNGNWQWAISAGSGYTDSSKSISVDSNGNSYITGYFQGTATFGSINLISSGGIDVFVAKVDVNGNWQWAIKAGGPSMDSSNDISVDLNGNSYIAGHFVGTSWFGSTVLTSSGGIDVFVAKVDVNGNWQWAISAGGNDDDDYGYRVGVDSNGNSYITGWYHNWALFGSINLTSNGAQDVFVAKVDVNGNWQWAISAGGNDNDYSRGIDVDSNGNSYITGHFKGTALFGSINLTSSGGIDVFVAKVDVNGNWQWAISAGGNDSAMGYGVSVDSNGNSYVTGAFYSTASFGSINLTSSGGADVFTAKLTSNDVNQPPTVEITYPVEGQTVSGMITIMGTADDLDGTVQQVEVKIDDGSWETATGTTSWSYSWDTTTIPDGPHVIYARSYDGEDYSEIDSVNVNVENIGNQWPTVEITYPVEGQTVSGTITITGTADDLDGTVQQVEVKIDEGSWETATGTTSWSYSWDTTTVSDGPHTIYARSYDGEDYSEEDSVNVNVDNDGNEDYQPMLFIPVCAPTLQYAHKDTKLTFMISVANQGSQSDTIDLSYSQDLDWTIQLEITSVTLDPGEATYFDLWVVVGDGTLNKIKVTATSRGDPSKIVILDNIKVIPIMNGYGLFAAKLQFENNDITDHILEFSVPDSVKISDHSIVIPASESKSINLLFDPGPSESDLTEFTLISSDVTNSEDASLLIAFTNCEVQATEFDMSYDSYSFPNWGIKIPIGDMEISGHCFGIAETSILYHNYRTNKQPRIKIPANKDYTYSLTKEEADGNIWLYQWLKLQKYWDTIILLFKNLDQEKEYNKLEDNIELGKSMLLNIKIPNSQDKGKTLHSVVAYKIVKRGDTAYIFIYDNEETYLYKGMSNDNYFMAFPYTTYNLNSHEFKYGSESACFLADHAEKQLIDKLKGIFNIECPVNVTLTDQYNRTISDDGTNEIPNASLINAGEVKTFFMPQNLTYDVNINAYDDGSFTSTVFTQIQDNISVRNIFLNISIIKDTKAYFKWFPNDPNQLMKIDYDGDGLVDEEKTPDISETIILEYPPDPPISPIGPTSGKPRVQYTYRTNTSDPEADQIYYLFDWGDNSDSGWLGPFDTGTTTEASHKWNKKGNYEIKVKAKDIYGFESDWSDPLPVTMPRNKPFFYNFPLLSWLFERFPNLFPILRHMLGL